MKLYYYKDKYGNFGDDLNIWLWDRLLPDFLDNDDSSIFIGIGTLLNSLLPKVQKKIVFSSGVGYKNDPPPVDQNWKIYCVRGPLSAKILNIDKKLAITDGAALLKTLPFPKLTKVYNISYVPHHHSHRPKWEQFCHKIGINYINPSKNVDFVISEILKSHLVISESMHGCILADTFRIPWIPVNFHHHILDFKWLDWCQSLNINFSPATLPFFLKREDINNKYFIRLKYILISFLIKKIAGSYSPFLSSDQVLETAVSRLSEKLDLIKKDYSV